MSAEKTPCGVDWCTWDNCGGDHWASPGEGQWPNLGATAWSPDHRQYVATAPTWCEMDGLSPAVLVWFQRITRDNVAELDETFEFTPDEADALAAQLTRAAAAARETTRSEINR